MSEFECADTGGSLAEILALRSAILYHQDAYYNGSPEISDAAFDILWDRLKKLSPNDPIFQKVGQDESKDFEKAKHLIPMGSQEKAANSEQFEKWYNKNHRIFHIVQYKLDGASIELQYINGSFVKAVTRGNGVVGDDVTDTIRRAQGVVKTLPDSQYTGGVRGEVLLTRDLFEKFYSDKANCRNAANGMMKRKSGEGAEHLTVICYDAMSTLRRDHFTTELEKIDWLKNQGFFVVPVKIFTDDLAGIIRYRDEVNALRPSLPYDIDGLVIKCNVLDFEDAKRARPEHQIAFKFSLDEQITTLREVEWSVSGRNRTPIAICDPVPLAGTIVKRANLCNPALLSSLGIKIGSKVVMVKRGEIIPKIERVLETPADAIPISIPENCECCGSLLTVEPSAVYCPNPKCDLTLEHRILKWTETVGIKFLGSAIIHTLYSAGAVKSVWGLYLARQKTLAPLIGEKVADKIVLEVSKHHDVTLPQLFAGYDLDGIGESAITLIQRAGYVTLEQIQATTIAALSDIKGIGFITAKKIKDALELYGLDFKILTASGSGLINLVYPSSEKLPLSGISFCFTGELTSLKREEAERNVKNLGGDILGSVSKNLSYLVTNDPDSGSSKANKAKELGIPIIDEVAFITMIQNAK